ncbi:transketolase [Clostridium puniceum]|uniref:Transketolase n=1 Tax=Clostridium puniceum TaxID=29367 RepID=A0A1S8TNX3_9CLOT|nr:transketolase [Clostridium puniceum]OOM79329.1 transketolase [Clostridium puniceum]
MNKELEQLSINSIRVLGIDAINKANSGHPGVVLGSAPMAYTLWTDHMKINPKNSNWFNRDRFVLAAGHGSMLLYSLLHLSGYNVTMDDLKSFRQWGSKTPGHPEYKHTDGIDATSGPLGQGIPMAIGMAMAEKFLSAKYNRKDLKIVDHYQYVICGDGDLMEGVTSEASSLAGHLGLGKLVVLYDSNDICLDGKTSDSFGEDVLKRYESYGWHVQKVEDGNDVEAISKAIQVAKNEINKPSLIEVKTVIGFGSKNQGKNEVHGAPLGIEDGEYAKRSYGWDYESFTIPKEVYENYKNKIQIPGQKAEGEWNALFEAYKQSYPKEALELEKAINGELVVELSDVMPKYEVGHSDATRNTNNKAINAIAKAIPYFIGGSADLSGSNKTLIKNEDKFIVEKDYGRNIYFGVREFSMASMLNGMALHGGVKVYGATFFVFSDYLKPAVRMAAIMGLPVTYVFTHDSIAVGEDGPTHEPIEQLAMFRSLPNMVMFRPADAVETAAAWRLAVESKDHPTALALTRQNVTVMDGSSYEGVEKGAYVISAAKGKCEGILIATGSEVNLAIRAQEALVKENIYVSVVSMPSMELFEKQSEEYKNQVLPKNIIKKLAIEMGTTFGWHKYANDVIGIDKFGASAPAEKVIKEYGFTVENIIERFTNIY